VTFRTRSIEEIREIFPEVRKDIWPAVESRKLQLPIDKVFSFDDIGKTFERMEAQPAPRQDRGEVLEFRQLVMAGQSAKRVFALDVPAIQAHPLSRRRRRYRRTR
jgi:hypothetical protein